MRSSKPDPTPGGPGREPGDLDWRALARNLALGTVFGRMMMPVAAGWLVIGAFILTMAWQNGPQRLLDAHAAAPYSVRKDGRIVESWIALEFRHGEMGTSTYWPAFARATPCAIVEIEGEWAGRRAYCGAPHWLHDNSYTIHDLRQMALGVPFDFKRDASGFAMPEMRVDREALKHLASLPWESLFHHGSALDELRKRFDRPVDVAVASWSSAPLRSFPLEVDPAHPSEPLPAGYLEIRRTRAPEWFPFFFTTGFGLAFWFAGMNIVLRGLVPIGRVVIGFLPLLAIPWWSEELPRGISHLSVEAGAEMRRILGDIDTEAQLTAGSPDAALLRGGAPLRFSVHEGLYADTIGRFHFDISNPFPKKTPDEALALLAASIASVVRTLATADRIELFDNLSRDKHNRYDGAGLAFLPAGREALLDPASTGGLRAAARRYLDEWTTSPLPEPRRGQPAFDARVKLFRGLTDVPVDYIANSASAIVERAERSSEPAKRRR